MPTRYRQLQRPTLLQTGLVDDSGAQTAARLADVFKQFESGVSQVGAALQTRRGAAEGAAAGAAGKPQMVEGWRSLTARSTAYNSAAEVTYTNKLQLDLDAALDRIELESEAEPDKYAELAKASVDGTLKDVPASMRPQIEQMAAARVNAGFSRLAVQADAKRKSEGVAAYIAGAPQRVSGVLKATKNLSPEEADAEMARAIADNDQQLAALVKENALTPVQAEQQRQAFIADLDAGVSGLKISLMVDDLMGAARLNVEDGDQALAELEKREDLSAEEKEDVRSKYREARNLLYFERSRQYIEETTDLARDLGNGDYGRSILTRAREYYQKGALSPDEYQSILKQSDRNAEAAIDEDSDAAAVAAILASGGKLDPGSGPIGSKHRKGLSALFDQAVEAGGMTPGDERWRAMAVGTTQQTNILAESAESWARIQLASGDPTAAISAARFVQQVQEAVPGAYAWNDEPELQAFADLLLTNVNAAIDPQKAYDTAHKSIYGIQPGVKKARLDAYSDLVRRDPNVNRLSKRMNKGRGLFGPSQLPVPEAAAAEYETLVREFFVISGDLEQARKLAGQQIEQNWGETRVNGEPEFTKYPLEKMGVDTEVVRQDIRETLKELGSDVDPDTVRLVPIEATDRTHGLQWGLEVRDADGNYDVIIGKNGREQAYTLPFAEEFDALKAKKKEEDLAKYRALRERLLRYEVLEQELRKQNLAGPR